MNRPDQALRAAISTGLTRPHTGRSSSPSTVLDRSASEIGPDHSPVRSTDARIRPNRDPVGTPGNPQPQLLHRVRTVACRTRVCNRDGIRPCFDVRVAFERVHINGDPGSSRAKMQSFPDNLQRALAPRPVSVWICAAGVSGSSAMRTIFRRLVITLGIIGCLAVVIGTGARDSRPGPADVSECRRRGHDPGVGPGRSRTGCERPHDH